MDPTQLTAEQRQMVLVRAQQEANQSVTQGMLEKMMKTCFTKCISSYSSGDKLDTKEQSCMANCQDRYLDVRKEVANAIEKRQG